MRIARGSITGAAGRRRGCQATPGEHELRVAGVRARGDRVHEAVHGVDAPSRAKRLAKGARPPQTMQSRSGMEGT
jgi:hypothetical protein